MTERFYKKVLKNVLKLEPWIKELATKPATKLTAKDQDKIVNNFICKYWQVAPIEISGYEILDILDEIKELQP